MAILKGTLPKFYVAFLHKRKPAKNIDDFSQKTMKLLHISQIIARSLPKSEFGFDLDHFRIVLDSDLGIDI